MPVSNVVNLPVDADVAPIAVPLIAPPVIAILSAAWVEIVPNPKFVLAPAAVVAPVPPLAKDKDPVIPDVKSMVGAFAQVAFPLASEVKILPAEAPVGIWIPPSNFELPTTSNLALGEVVPIPTFTASEPVPPNTILLSVATFAFLPIAVILVNEVLLLTVSDLDAWKPIKVE